MSGVGLYLGALLISVWLVAAATGPEAYAVVENLALTFLGQLVLFGFTVAVLYHLANGIRHLFWDAGKGYSPSVANITAMIPIVFAIAGAGLIWVLADFITL